MSGGKSLRGGITRRGFMKGAAAVGALGVAAGGMTATSNWFAPAKAYAEAEETVCSVPHLVHCGGGCTLDCTVRNGRMVSVQPHSLYDERNRKQCLRAVGEISNTYSVDRIQTPLRRVGERGEGKFEQISWDEAIDAIATAFKEAQEAYGKDAVFIKKTIEALNSHGFNFIPTYIGCQTEALSGIDRNIANGFIPAFMQPHGLAADSVWAWEDSKTIINIAHNHAETAIPWFESVALAREAGAKFIDIDPRFSPTAGKADQWIAPIPGQDPALFLGVLNAMVENGWYDEEFMLAHTSMADLVDVETGALLGEMEQWMHPMAQKEVPARVPMVWDAVANAAVVYSVASAPALEGEFTVDGKKVVTQFTLLKQQIADYTPEWAAEKSGVDEQVIIDLADRYANAGPAVINWGMGGPDKFTNGDILGHTLAIMAAITGNYGKRGAGIGAYPGGGGMNSGIAATFPAWPTAEGFKPAAHPVPFFDMPVKENNVHAVMFFGDVPFLQRGNANETAEWLKGLDFVAVAEIYNSTVVSYADIVLPSTSRFECSEDWKALRSLFGNVLLQQKALEPMFEAKDDLEIERLILAKWDCDQYLPETYEELARFQLSKSQDKKIEGLTFEKLVEAGGVYHMPAAVDPTVTGATTPVLKTHTGRAELYYENLIEFNQAFPQFEEPSEAYADNPLAEKYPLIFLTGKTRFRNHSYMSNTPWFHQMYGEPLMLNPVDASSRGLKDGDTVRVFNDRGEFTAMLQVDESIRPGSAYMAEERFLQYSPGGLMQNVTNSTCIPRSYTGTHGAQVPFNDNLVEIKKA